MSEPEATASASTARRVRWALVAAIVAVAGAGAAAWALKPDEAAEQGGGRTNAPTPVRVAQAAERELTLTAKHTGELHAEVAEIAARTPGVLEEVRVRIGDPVEQGDLLARVDTAQLVRQLAEVRAQRAAAEANARRTEAGLGAARAELERTEPLLEDQLVSAQEITALRARVDGLVAEGAAASAQADEAQARLALIQQQISDARLTAPFDGAVAERYLDPGAVVQHGTPVLRVVRSGPLRVRFRVPERDLGRLETGLPIAVTTQATADQRFTGRVERISAAVAREDRSVAVEGILEEEVATLRPGMYAEVALELGTLEDAIVVPGAAVLERPGREEGEVASGVFVATNGTARWTPVEVVGRSGDDVAVRGIDAGTPVVVVGHDTLRDGAEVRVVEGGAGATAGEAAERSGERADGADAPPATKGGT